MGFKSRCKHGRSVCDNQFFYSQPVLKLIVDEYVFRNRLPRCLSNRVTKAFVCLFACLLDGYSGYCRRSLFVLRHCSGMTYRQEHRAASINCYSSYPIRITQISGNNVDLEIDGTERDSNTSAPAASTYFCTKYTVGIILRCGRRCTLRVTGKARDFACKLVTC